MGEDDGGAGAHGLPVKPAVGAIQEAALTGQGGRVGHPGFLYSVLGAAYRASAA